MDSINKGNLDKLIEHIKKGNIKLTYCYPVTYDETALAVSSMLANGLNVAENGEYNFGMTSVFSAACASNPLSTEIVLCMISILAADNEFYYSAALTDLCCQYFSQLEASEISADELPTVVQRMRLCIFQQAYLKEAFDAAEHDDLEAFEKYVELCSCNQNVYKFITKNTEDIKRDIKRYYDWR